MPQHGLKVFGRRNAVGIQEHVEMPGRKRIKHLQRSLPGLVSPIADKDPSLLWKQACAFQQSRGDSFCPTTGVRQAVQRAQDFWDFSRDSPQVGHDWDDRNTTRSKLGKLG